MNVEKMAKQDAARWAYAEMFFGEGAGTRRKLLTAEINSKQDRIPGYFMAFERAYEKQNFGDLAIRAAKERKRIDRGALVKRNTKGILTGNRRQLSTAVAVVVVGYSIAHQTGMDVVIKDEVVHRYKKVRTWVEVQRAKRKLRVVK